MSRPSKITGCAEDKMAAKSCHDEIFFRATVIGSLGFSYCSGEDRDETLGSWLDSESTVSKKVHGPELPVICLSSLAGLPPSSPSSERL
jgi:hypothetical protein